MALLPHVLFIEDVSVFFKLQSSCNSHENFQILFDLADWKPLPFYRDQSLSGF
jgi:hypothetical protein